MAMSIGRSGRPVNPRATRGGSLGGMSTPNWAPAVEIHLRIRVPESRRGALLEFLAEAVPFYESPGGIRVTLLREAGDPERYIERIGYRTEADYERDRHRVESDPEMRAMLERWRAIIEGPPVVEVYRPG